MRYTPLHQVANGTLTQSGDGANTFMSIPYRAGSQYKRMVRGFNSKNRILSGHKFFAMGWADYYPEDYLLIIPLLNKYKFSSTFYVQCAVPADNITNSFYDKRELSRVGYSGCFLGNHGPQHWTWLHLFPLNDGVLSPSNTDFRTERADGTNAFGFDVDATLNDSYSLGICSSTYLNISFGATSFRNLTDANCLELRTKLSFWVGRDYRYGQDLLKTYDQLSNKYCGTTGYSVVGGNYITRTPNTVGGVYPTTENKIQGGIFQGAATTQNHEVWERVEQIITRYTYEIHKRNNELKYWATPGGVFNSILYVPVNNPNVSRKYHDAACTKIANGFTKHTSSITGVSRGFMDVLKTNGYKATMSANDGFGTYGYDGQQRKEMGVLYKLNSSLSKTSDVGHGYYNSIRVYDTDTITTALTTLMASNNIMFDKYEYTKQYVGATSLSTQNNFAQVIEDICKRIAWGLIPSSVDDSGALAPDLVDKRACLALTLELIYQFCKLAGIEVISHEEATDISYATIDYGENSFPNHGMATTVKDIIGSALCDQFPDGWSGGTMIIDGVDRTYNTDVKTFIRNYLVKFGNNLINVDVKGVGSIDVYRIRNANARWLGVYEPDSTCGFELIGSITVNSVGYENKSLSFEVIDEAIKTYTTETENYQNYLQGLDDKICGLHIEIVPSVGQSVTIKNPSLTIYQ